MKVKYTISKDDKGMATMSEMTLSDFHLGQLEYFRGLLYKALDFNSLFLSDERKEFGDVEIIKHVTAYLKNQ